MAAGALWIEHLPVSFVHLHLYSPFLARSDLLLLTISGDPAKGIPVRGSAAKSDTLIYSIYIYI